MVGTFLRCRAVWSLYWQQKHGTEPDDDLKTYAITFYYYRPPEGGRLYDMKVVSGYAFLRTYFV